MPPRSITDDQVAQALALKGKMTVRRIADEVGISTGNVCNIHNGKFRTETNRDLELAPGEKYCEHPVRCSQCGSLNHVLPCRTCRTEAYMRKVRTGPDHTCKRCGRTAPVNIKGNQVRCGKCGNFVCRRDQLEPAAERAADAAANPEPADALGRLA